MVVGSVTTLARSATSSRFGESAGTPVTAMSAHAMVPATTEAMLEKRRAGRVGRLLGIKQPPFTFECAAESKRATSVQQ